MGRLADFEKAFKNLTDGRQRGYLLHFEKPTYFNDKVKLPVAASNLFIESVDHLQCKAFS